MSSLMARQGDLLHEVGRSQDVIDWRRFMEGMISRDRIHLVTEDLPRGCGLLLDGKGVGKWPNYEGVGRHS